MAFRGVALANTLMRRLLSNIEVILLRPAVHVLLVYSLDEQKLVRDQVFEDGKDALEAYSTAEREHLGKSNYEIVLIAADSEETIRHTHASYFDESVELPQLHQLARMLQ